MFELESMKIIHSTSDRNFVIENEADIVAKLRDISARGKSDIEEKHEELQAVKLTNKKPVIEKKDENKSEIVERNEQTAMRERLANKYGKRGAMSPKDVRERMVQRQRGGGGTGGSTNVVPTSMPTFGSANHTEVELQIVREGQNEDTVKSDEDFMAELKARINKTEEKVQKVEELKKHNVASDGEINVIKTDNIAEEIYSRQKDEEREKEIAEILKQRQEDLKKYKPMRKKEEASGGFKPPKKQARGAKKWTVIAICVLGFSLFCGFRANGYCFDEYGSQPTKINQLTGEVEAPNISSLSCLFSSFTVESVTMFPPVFNSEVFFTAFGMAFSICAVAVLLIWSSADTKKRNRDGKEHGDSKIATYHDIKAYQQMFMDD